MNKGGKRKRKIIVFPVPPSAAQMFHAWLCRLAGYAVAFRGIHLWLESAEKEVFFVNENPGSFTELFENMKDEIAVGVTQELGYEGARFVVKLRIFVNRYLSEDVGALDLLDCVYRGCLLSHAEMRYVMEQYHSVLFKAVNSLSIKDLEDYCMTVIRREREFANHLAFKKFRTGGQFVIVTREKIKNPSLYVFHRYPEVEAVYWFSKDVGNPEVSVRRNRLVKVKDSEVAYIKSRLALPPERKAVKIETGGEQ